MWTFASVGQGQEGNLQYAPLTPWDFEFKTLIGVIEKYGTPYVQDDSPASQLYGSEMGYFQFRDQVNTFKWLHSDNEYNAEICYNSFVSFKREHEDLFTSKMKTLILKTAAIIAASFSGQNKSELMMLGKLSIEFKK